MKVSHIVPGSLLSLIEGQDYHLVIPALLSQDEDYVAYYSEDRGFKILDNGAAEDDVQSIVHLMQWAEQIKADEIVIPDVIGNSRMTLNLANTWKGYDVKPYKLMGVVQGSNHSEMLTCLTEMLKMSHISTLGLPRHCVSFHPRMRYLLAERALALNPHKPIHLLGVNSEQPYEVADLTVLPNVRGIDTSFPTFCGMSGFDIQRDNVIGARRPPDFYDYIPDHEAMMQIRVNMARFDDWADANE